MANDQSDSAHRRARGIADQVAHLALMRGEHGLPWGSGASRRTRRGVLYHRDDMEHREDRLAQRHRIGLELLADDAGSTGSQGLLADLAEHLGGDLGAEALERKSARLGLGGCVCCVCSRFVEGGGDAVST